MRTRRMLPTLLGRALLAPALVGAALLAAGCTTTPLGDPATALARVQELVAAGDTEEAAALGGRLTESTAASATDRAEGAFLAGEAEMELGEHARAFTRYRYVLENAPWSPHAVAIEERLFEIGKALLFGEEYDGWFSDRTRGVDALETLQGHYRTSERADDALKLVGDYFAGEDVQDWGEAAAHYQRVADEYPDSEWAERCLWLAGHSRLTGSAGPQYDRNDLLAARETLERSVKTHPRGVAIREARADLAETLEKLAEAELVVADFYRDRGLPAGENLRLANAALLYPDTRAGREAVLRLGEQALDLKLLAGDPRLQSVDKVKATQPVWDQGRDKRRGHNAFGPSL